MNPHVILAIFKRNFLSYFADKGYRAVALSFRGHGESPSDKPLRVCSVADYIDDVRSVAERLPSSPVIIGHSFGVGSSRFVAATCSM